MIAPGFCSFVGFHSISLIRVPDEMFTTSVSDAVGITSFGYFPGEPICLLQVLPGSLLQNALSKRPARRMNWFSLREVRRHKCTSDYNLAPGTEEEFLPAGKQWMQLWPIMSFFPQQFIFKDMPCMKGVYKAKRSLVTLISSDERRTPGVPLICCR